MREAPNIYFSASNAGKKGKALRRFVLLSCVRSRREMQEIASLAAVQERKGKAPFGSFLSLVRKLGRQREELGNQLF